MPLVSDGHGNLTYRIIGACMAVHNDLGPGHREIVYQRALARKFDELGIEYEEFVELVVQDENGDTLIVYKPDFRIKKCVWLEIKAQSWQLTGDDEAQLIDYFSADILETCNVGLLVNFGRPRLQYERKFPPDNLHEFRRKRWGYKPKE
ncbi:MAG: GxxExxY protein [Chloroflexi bacterium]|nr:GxxExxY protein [Chloroflexota bacterium]